MALTTPQRPVLGCERTHVGVAAIHFASRPATAVRQHNPRSGNTRDETPPLVGRDDEVDALDAALHAALAGRGQVLLLAGEPGIGKTRLAEEAGRLARASGMVCRWGRAVEDEGSPPYWPFRQVLRALTGFEGADRSDLSPVVPELGAPSAAGVSAEEQFRAFDAVTGFLTSAAAANGLLVVLDDIHWADASSLRLLVHLARGLAESRLAVIATYRDMEAGQRDALKQALGALSRESVVSRLRLVGLTESQVGDQLAAVTGRAVADDVAAVVSARSLGNPFFVAELGRLLTGRAPDLAAAHLLPDGVRDAVRGRLAQLSPIAGQVVSAAAVVGADVDPIGVARAMGIETDTVLSALDEAADAAVLSAADGWHFTHDLVREVARLDVPRSARLDLHQRMAEVLERQPDAAIRPTELAHHWLASLPVGDTARAIHWAERAGEAAMHQLAWDDAAEWYRQAAAIASEPDHRCELLISQARAQLRGYRLSDARESTTAAAGIARQLDDPDFFARSVLVMEGINDIAWAEDERRLCEQALARLPPGDSALRARLIAQSSVGHMMAERSADSSALSQDALAMAERVGDRAALRAALRARQMACSAPDGVRERLMLGDRLLAVGTADGDDDAVLWGRLWRFDALMQLGELDRADSECDPIATTAARLRLPMASWHSLRCQGEIALARGRFVEARSLGNQAIALAERAGHTGGMIPSRGFLSMISMLTGTNEMRPRAFPDEWALATPMHALIALLHWYEGRREEARRVYAGLPDPSRVAGFILPWRVCTG